MKKIEIYKENGRLVLCEFANMNSEVPFSIKYDDEVRNYLNEIIDRYELKARFNNDTVLEFQNPQETYDKVVYYIDSDALNNDYIKPLNDLLGKKRKRVSRKNKHVGKIIVASALVVTTLLSVAAGGKKKSEVKNNEETIYYSTLNNEDETNNTVFYDEKENDAEIDTTIINDEEKTNNAEDDTITVDNKEINENEEITTTNEFEVPSSSSSIYNLDINYDGITPDYDKLEYVKENYGKLIEDCCEIYGIDSNIMIAIATQERGVHSPYMDAGGATGLMQIQNAVWVGEKLTAFNCNDNEYETITVTNDLISSLEGNIKAGCMIFSYCIEQMDGNVLLAIQCYNMGQGNMYRKVLNYYSSMSGKTVEQIVSNPSDIGWIEYRFLVTQGDRRYLERILSYIEGDIRIKSLGAILCINSFSKDSIDKKVYL